MNEDLSHVEAAQRTGYGNRARLDIDLKQTLQEKAIAERKHENAIQEQAAKESQLQSFASRRFPFQCPYRKTIVKTT